MTYKRFIPTYRPLPMELEAEERRLRNRDAARGTAGLPLVPPVIDSFYPSENGLPPGVHEEWSLGCLRDAKTDKEGPRDKRGCANDSE